MTLPIEALQDARWLPLTAIPASPAAIALVDAVTERVAVIEAKRRRTERRAAGRAKLSQAVASIIGGLLEAWRKGDAVFRSRKLMDFSGGNVGARQYLAAIDALGELGLVNVSASIRYGGLGFSGDPEVFGGKARRQWPSVSLLDLAVGFGVVPATVKTDFSHCYPTTPPKVPEALQMHALESPTRRDRLRIPIRQDDRAAARIRSEVEGFNDWIAGFRIAGCLPPRWKRVFTSSWLLGGRWYAVGADGCYQRMGEDERLRITIESDPVVEADVSASHLSIMHGLLGLPLPDGDLYAVGGVSRGVVKAWLTATLGKGSPVTRWGKRTLRQTPEVAAYPAKEVAAAVVRRYPFLHNPAAAVADAAGLTKLADRLGVTPQKLLTHCLMNIEAKAMTGAMQVLRSRGIPALPIHDSLLVPASGAGHVESAIVSAFAIIAKISGVRVKMTRADAHGPRMA